MSVTMSLVKIFSFIEEGLDFNKMLFFAEFSPRKIIGYNYRLVP